MAQHRAKKLYRVEGQGSNPSDLRFDGEMVRAHSEAQAKHLVERRFCQKLGRRKIFWASIEAYEVQPAAPIVSQERQEPVVARRDGQTKPRAARQIAFGY